MILIGRNSACRKLAEIVHEILMLFDDMEIEKHRSDVLLNIVISIFVYVLLMNRILRLMCVDSMPRLSYNGVSSGVELNPFQAYIIDSFINSISRLFFLIFVFSSVLLSGWDFLDF